MKQTLFSKLDEERSWPHRYTNQITLYLKFLWPTTSSSLSFPVPSNIATVIVGDNYKDSNLAGRFLLGHSQSISTFVPKKTFQNRFCTWRWIHEKPKTGQFVAGMHFVNATIFKWKLRQLYNATHIGTWHASVPIELLKRTHMLTRRREESLSYIAPINFSPKLACY